MSIAVAPPADLATDEVVTSAQAPSVDNLATAFDLINVQSSKLHVLQSCELCIPLRGTHGS